MWTIELCKNKNKSFYHRLVGSNGKIVYVSESYASKQGAMKTIKRLLETLKHSKLEVHY